jgi:hypothetical protein
MLSAWKGAGATSRARCRDILGNEDLPVHEGCIPRRIPVGSVRIVDGMRDKEANNDI